LGRADTSLWLASLISLLKTLAAEPPIKPGTPDLYTPPAPGELRAEEHIQIGPITQYVTALVRSHDELPDPTTGSNTKPDRYAVGTGFRDVHEGRASGKAWKAYSGAELAKTAAEMRPPKTKFRTEAQRPSLRASQIRCTCNIHSSAEELGPFVTAILDG
jgi:hypothetical protein